MRLIIFFVFIARTTTDGTNNSTYIGCFKEPSRDDRLLKVYKLFPNTLTSSTCISYCAENGYNYAGLEYMKECHCSYERPSSEFAINENECNMKCDGNNQEICGGDLKLNVYSTGVKAGPNYLGCYVDRAHEARLLPNELKIFQDTMTPKICIDHCKGKGYDYAGLEYRHECFCANLRPTYKSSADDSECDMECEGDQSQICGGSLRLSVYETKEKLDNFVEQNYLGCYLDIRANLHLDGKHKTFNDTLTPEICIGFCYRSGYRFAGTQNGNECICGDHDNLEFIKLLDSECNTKCLNSKLMCGGHWKNGVYSTDIPDYSEVGKVIGCFTDSTESPILPAVKMDFKDTCTPKLCFNICLQLGYKYSGVETGYQCFCGNNRPDGAQAAENQCLTPCSGSSEKYCGGSKRILVFSTDVGNLKNGK